MVPNPVIGSQPSAAVYPAWSQQDIGEFVHELSPTVTSVVNPPLFLK